MTSIAISFSSTRPQRGEGFAIAVIRSLDLTAVEKPIGPWTMRTKGTLEQLHSKYFA